MACQTGLSIGLFLGGSAPMTPWGLRGSWSSAQAVRCCPGTSPPRVTATRGRPGLQELCAPAKCLSARGLLAPVGVDGLRSPG